MFRKHGKPLLVLFLILYAAFLLMPAGIYGLYLTQPGGNLPAGDATQDAPAPSPSPSGETAPAAAEVAPEFLEGITLPGRSPAPSSEPFTVYDTATGQTLSLTPQEFLPAALACEMDLSAPAGAIGSKDLMDRTLRSFSACVDDILISDDQQPALQ